MKIDKFLHETLKFSFTGPRYRYSHSLVTRTNTLEAVNWTRNGDILKRFIVKWKTFIWETSWVLTQR